MDITKDALNKLNTMSSAELKAAIGVIADSLGATQGQKRMAQNNAQLLKRKITGMKQEDINKFLSQVPQEKLSELKSKLGI